MSRPSRWLLGAAAVMALGTAAHLAASSYIRSARASRALSRRLESAFGRPVQVARYDFSLWSGPRIEADSLTVGEDPRFGQEYFLRARSVSATLRWRALVRGRLEFGSFSFSQPSLNIVTAGGRWNLDDWLPPASPGIAGGRSQTPLLYRVEFDGGRINFKRGDDKLPFALVDVHGRVDERATGRWAIAVEARPMRVAVNLQDAGVLRLTGEVAGTSARLRPANLDLHWDDASLSDVLRLLRGYDPGIRGRQNLELRAASTGGIWQFELAAQARDLHRWNMTAQPGDPALNLRLAGTWQPETGKLAFGDGRLEGLESMVGITGEVDWPGAPPRGPAPVEPGPRVSLHLATAGLGAQDLLAWYRSFHPGVSPGLRASGWLQGTLSLAQWPPRITQAKLSAIGVRVDGDALPAPISLATARASLSGNQAHAFFTGLDFGGRVGEFELAGRAWRSPRWRFQLQADGTTPQIALLLAAGKSLGIGFPGYCAGFSGPAGIKLVWAGGLAPFERILRTSLEFHDAIWRDPPLAAQARLLDVRMDAGQGGLRLDVLRLDALGARWTGWLWRSNQAGSWQFDLKADRWDVRPLVERLQPRPRQAGLLERILGSTLAPKAPPSWLAALKASGRLKVQRLTAGPLALDRLDGIATIRDGALTVDDARATLFGGMVRGRFFFSVLERVPVWNVRARIANFNLARLAQATSGAAASRFSGVASGDLSLRARGATAANLLHSLEGRAQLTIHGATDRRIDWVATLRDGRAAAGRSSFAAVSARIRMADGKLTFQDLQLVGDRGRVEATGGIDFNATGGAALAVDARLLPYRSGQGTAAARGPRTIQVTGTAADPLIRLRAPDPPRPR